MCWACHLEGAGLNGWQRASHSNKQKPRLSPETLTQFWMEDVSDLIPLRAAGRYFEVTVGKIRKVMLSIKV